MATLLTSIGSPPRPRAGRRWLRAAGGVALGTLVIASALAADPKLLPPEQAFRFSARALDARTLEARFAVADGYYLYRDKIKFSAAPEATALGGYELPAGKVKDDQFFGRVETYRGTVIVRLPIERAAARQSVVLSAESQGCADLGVCYPPTLQKVTLTLPADGKGPGAMVDANPAKKNWLFN